MDRKTQHRMETAQLGKEDKRRAYLKEGEETAKDSNVAETMAPQVELNVQVDMRVQRREMLIIEPLAVAL